MDNTDYYLSEISKMSNKFGDKLMSLMNTYNKSKLIDITVEEAKEFYENLIKQNIA